MQSYEFFSGICWAARAQIGASFAAEYRILRVVIFNAYPNEMSCSPGVIKN